MKMLAGGMERWCCDLALLTYGHGMDVTIYQKANRSFETEIAECVRVVGVKSPLTFRGNWILSKWLERNTDTSDPFVFVSQEMVLSDRIHRSVAVNHGIWWDGDVPWWKRALNRRLQRRLVNRTKATVCVDTNYINWRHAEPPNREQWEQKLLYVPNDTDMFGPQKVRTSPAAPQ